MTAAPTVPTAMARAGLAGLAYFSIVFLVGFGLGTIRTLLVAPRLGQTSAVLLETPLMLMASWAACRQCVRWFEVPPGLAVRAGMGAVAFALLMAAELALSMLLFRRDLAAFIAAYAAAPGPIGLAAQVMFGLMPLLAAKEAVARASPTAP